MNPSTWNTPKSQPDDGFALYKISFQWYAVIGVITFWLPAVIISHLTGGQDLNKFNINLLSPFIQNWLPMKYRHTELSQIENKISINEKTNETAFRHELTELITPPTRKASL